MDGNGGAPQVIRIFESYGWKDAADVAERLKGSLEESGYQVWIDREHLHPDDKHFSFALEDAVSNSEVVVALLSPHSLRGLTGDQRSSICYNELLVAHRLERPIVPVKVAQFDGTAPFLIVTYRTVDWLDWERPESYRKGVAEITTLIERALANETLLDPDITFQANNFKPQLRTAEDTFTGREWLFDRLDAWLAGPGRCLMIEGDTGTGKTAVVAELIRRNPGRRLLAYHFCTPAASTLDPISAVKSLAGMLATGVDAYAERLQSGTLGNALTGKDAAAMLGEGVLEPLRKVAMVGSYYLVVDALDEAFAGGNGALPVLLAGALPQFPSWLKLVVTSRPHHQIRGLFGGAEWSSLSDGSASSQDDLRALVARRLAEPSITHIVGADQRDAAIGLVEASAAGNFQYAGSVLDALVSGDMMLSQLDTLPRTLGDLYYLRAQGRFPDPSDYQQALIVLEVLLSAREPLTRSVLSATTDLSNRELVLALDAINCFAGSTDGAWRIAHKSIADWLMSDEAGMFRVDPAPGRRRILAYCEGWAEHHDPYAMKFVITHLLDACRLDEAMNVVRRGLFEQRGNRLHQPRLDAEDSRKLTAALIAARRRDGILALAQTPSTWQRDGVASALQSALESPPAELLSFVDGVVAGLLTVTA
ncbi:MAG: hypothetical protein QOH91_2059 [Mycobacterium sp.]|nr:hypothetical protein [Mycobacterium sp.]